MLHTDATQVRDWEQFRIYDLSEGGVAPTYFAIQTIRGNYLTAVGEGGKYEDAVHTDATQIGLWEHFRIVKCGDLGNGYQYNIIPANDTVLTAVKGGGLDRGDTIVQGFWPGDTLDGAWARFKLIRQSDGTYALQTFNGMNYVTALGEVEKFRGICLLIAGLEAPALADSLQSSTLTPRRCEPGRNSSLSTKGTVNTPSKPSAGLTSAYSRTLTDILY